MYERKHIKNCYEVIDYLINRDSDIIDVLEVKAQIYRNYKDFMIKDVLSCSSLTLTS